MDSFSNTFLYPSGAVWRSSRRMLLLMRVSSGSIAVFEISVFRSNMNSNSAFFMFSSVISLFVVKFPSMWLIGMFFASFPSVFYLFRSTIDKLSPRIIMLYSSVSSGSWSVSTSSRLCSGYSWIGW